MTNNTIVIKLVVDDNVADTIANECDVRLAAGYYLRSSFFIPDGSVSYVVLIFQPEVILLRD